MISREFFVLVKSVGDNKTQFIIENWIFDYFKLKKILIIVTNNKFIILLVLAK